MARKIDLQYLIDQEEIKQLRHDFAWHLDTSQPDALADLFTEDGFIDAGPWGRMNDRDAIRKGYRKVFLGGPEFGGMHSVTNGRVEIDGDNAKGSWYLLDISCRGEKDDQPIVLLGLYHETYRRTPDGWRMTSMTLQSNWSNWTGQVTPDNPQTTQRRAPERIRIAMEANARLAAEEAGKAG